ncbi:MAG: hypothetical protein R2834_07910 [Rhodothermales bacterium]
MATRIPYRPNVAWLALVAAVLLGAVVRPATGQIAVVANKSVPVESLDKHELLRLFAGDIEYWDNGEAVVIVDLSAKGEVRDSFYAYLGKTSSRMRSIWLKRKLTGEGELPRTMDSEEALLDAIASTHGAIGFASLPRVAQHPDVKVLIDSIPVQQ